MLAPEKANPCQLLSVLSKKRKPLFEALPNCFILSRSTAKILYMGPRAFL